MLRNSTSSSSSEVRRTVKLELDEREAADTASKEKELTLQLTDPADPLFFYSLTLTESDFGALRRQQGPNSIHKMLA